MPVEFICEGCGVPVVSYAWEKRPPHGLCFMCSWLCEHVADPEEIEQLRLQLRRREGEGGFT